MDNQNNNQRKLPIPKHLTDKEKANLMVAWARTHNKIDREAGTITYPDGTVGKLKPKMESKEETPPQEATEDNRLVVSKMEQMTPKERANHDLKLSFFKKALQMSKEDEQNKTETLQPKLFEALNNGTKIVEDYIERGVYKLSDITEELYFKLGDISKELFDAIKQSYAAFRENADDSTYNEFDENTRNFTYEYFKNKFKMEQSKLTDAETLGRKQLMKFLETLILNFKSKGISSQSLMGLSKAYYLLDNYKKITHEGYLRLESTERDEEGDFRSYVFRIDSDEAILSYEGCVHGPYGGDSVYEEMFNFDYNQGVFDDPEVIISSWIEEFENIFNNNGSLSIDDSTEEIDEIDEEDDYDYDQEDDEQEDYEQEEE